MLPIIDISPLAHGDLDARRAVVRRIGETCETVGFLYIANHGVDQAVIDHARDAMERFFARPEAEKRALQRREGTLRGYIPTMPFGANRPAEAAADDPARCPAHDL